MSDIALPNKWIARDYQKPLMQHMLVGGLEKKRGLCVWHRRAGKDSSCLNFAAVASQIRVGTIWHMLPTLRQGRKVIWDGIDKYGRRMIDQAFPREMRSGKNDSDMMLRLRNGSVYQVVGSDNYDSLVGANPVGVIFSEYSIADPTAWDFIRPILTENKGWALFIYTPRGRNHGKKLYDAVLENPKWYVSRLTINDTRGEDGNPLVLPEDIAEERATGMSEEKINQEYFCSWDSGLEGAFYTAELQAAEKEGRVGEYPWDPSKPCQTWWDLGFRDATAVIITQRGSDGKPIAIDYLEERNKSLQEWIHLLRSYPYDYEENWGPHDLEQHDYSTGKTRREFAEALKFPFNVVPKISLEDGINATRAMIRVMKFNEEKTEKLINGLYCYRREWDEKAGIFRDKPIHDWASHPADVTRYLSVGWEEHSPMGRKIDPRKTHNVRRAYGGKRWKTRRSVAASRF